MDPFDAVATWRPVSDRWVLHRPEPLLHERAWGCALELTPSQAAEQPWRCEGGFDAGGRPIAWRQFDPEGRQIDAQIVAGEGDARVVRGSVGDGDGDGDGDECYEYDERGRIIAIHEDADLYPEPRSWLASGGRLAVEYDGEELARITDEHGVVWERPDRPWDDELREGADEIAAACLEVIADACRAEGVPAGTEVFGLMLNYVEQGSLHFSLHFGLEADRRTWPAERRDGEELALKLLDLVGDDGLGVIEEEVVAPELDLRLLRGASINQPGDPYRAVLGEVARRLATASFAPMLEGTDDFVVFVAEHDEGLAPKVRSIREHNPPEQVARWEASWPAGAPRGEDEPF